ncbi:EpsG family protein [Peribacillus muralis]|uniref:EpsG family protein n=1 Tax=Peribacillus muralis TaxID=264697 RepID=UPI00070F3AFC|nr:EpsG family protein [Peribacillus muralis]
MTILWINLAIVFIFSFLGRYFSSYSLVTPTGLYEFKPNKSLVFLAIICLVCVSGLRTNIGDTFNYKNIYIDNDFTWEYISSQKDMGFGILQMLLKNFSDDPQILIFTTALITNILIMIVLYKYSRLFELSTFVYITGGLHLVSMNGIRQVLAAAIFFTATKYLLNGNFMKYSLVVLLASTFHQSALILIPIYFLVRTKAWTKSTLAWLSLSVIVVIGFGQFSTLLFSALQDTQYSDYSKFNEGGANLIRVAVSAAPLLIAYLGKDKLRKLLPNSDYIVNMALLGLIFMILSTQQWIFARISIYFNLYQLILISWLIELFNKRDQKLMYYLILVLFFVFYFYENVISLNILYKSDVLENLF